MIFYWPPKTPKFITNQLQIEKLTIMLKLRYYSVIYASCNLWPRSRGNISTLMLNVLMRQQCMLYLFLFVESVCIYWWSQSGDYYIPGSKTPLALFSPQFKGTPLGHFFKKKKSLFLDHYSDNDFKCCDIPSNRHFAAPVQICKEIITSLLTQTLKTSYFDLQKLAINRFPAFLMCLCICFILCP